MNGSMDGLAKETLCHDLEPLGCWKKITPSPFQSRLESRTLSLKRTHKESPTREQKIQELLNGRILRVVKTSYQDPRCKELDKSQEKRRKERTKERKDIRGVMRVLVLNMLLIHRVKVGSSPSSSPPNHFLLSAY